MKHIENFEKIEKRVLLNGLRTKVSGGYNTSSRYLLVLDPKTEKEVKIRFADHSQVYNADYSVDEIDGTLEGCIEFLKETFGNEFKKVRQPRGSYTNVSFYGWTFLVFPDKFDRYMDITTGIIHDEKINDNCYPARNPSQSKTGFWQYKINGQWIDKI